MRESWEYYNEIADRYDRMYEEPYWQLYHKITEMLVDEQLSGVSKVLDLGTGTGRWGLRLAGKGHSVTAIDPAEEMLRIARQKAERTGLTVEFISGSGDRLPLRNESFDFVLAMGDVLSYVKDCSQVLAEVNRVLKVGGKLLATVDNAWAFLQDFLSLGEYRHAGRLVDGSKVPIGDRSVSEISFLSKAYFPCEIEFLLESNGFESPVMASLVAFYPYSKEALARNLSSAAQWEYDYCKNRETFARAEHLFFCGKKR